MIAKMFSRSSSEGGPEDQEQISLFTMIDLMTHRFPELRCCHHVPNGGQRSAATAGRLKAEGVRPGVPDVHLPVPHGGYCGLWIEMKRAHGGRLSPEQVDWISYLTECGHTVIVAHGADDAMQKVKKWNADSQK